MKINLNIVLRDHKGNELEDKSSIGSIIFTALNAPLREDADKPMRFHTEKYEIIKKVLKGGEVKFTSSEINMIKERLPKCGFFAIVIGQVYSALEGEPDFILSGELKPGNSESELKDSPIKH